jgi:hypothetical protein
MMLGALASTVPATAAVATVNGRGPGRALPAPGMPELPLRQGAVPLPPPEETRSEVERHVQSLAQGRPEAVAEVVQAWLREE